MSGIVQGFMNFIQAGLKSFSDAFTRNTSGSLGTPWEAIKGTWFANGTKAQSNDLASNNSIAVVQMSSPNVTASAENADLGTGISFLVSDSNNWWAAVGPQDNDTYTYAYNQAYTATGTGSSQSYYYGRYSYSYSYIAYYYLGSPRYGSATAYVTTGPFLQTTYYYYTYNAVANPAIDALAITNYSLKLLKSVAGTVSTIVSTALTGISNKISIVISGTSVSAEAFDNSSPRNSLGTATTTLDSLPTATKTGIILSTSAQNQGYTIGYFTATN